MSKQLGEFLQEQQEPFILEVYLLERGYSTRRFSCNVGTLLKRSVSSGLKGNRAFIPSCSNFLRVLFRKLNSSETSQIGICGKESVLDDDDEMFSSASSATIFNSCSEGDAEEAFYSYFSRKDEQILSKRKVSPVSITEDTEVKDASPFNKKNDDGNIRRRRHFQFSALLGAYRSETPYFCRPDSSSQCSRNKKALQQTKQLLFDCAREAVERVKNKRDDEEQSPQILGPDELWEIICDDISKWSEEPINETNASRLVHFDLIASAQEWSKLEQQEREELGMQIADEILDDIRNEIIRDMTNLQSL